MCDDEIEEMIGSVLTITITKQSMSLFAHILQQFFMLLKGWRRKRKEKRRQKQQQNDNKKISKTCDFWAHGAGGKITKQKGGNNSVKCERLKLMNVSAKWSNVMCDYY